MKKKVLLLLATVIAFYLVSCGVNSESDESLSSVDKSDILSILFHQQYLESAGINVHYQSERKKMPDKISTALQEKPYIVKQEDGGLFGSDYYAVTKNQFGYYYYGEIKDNRPHGFGVLSTAEINLDNLDSISHLVYAGNFKKGIYNGYGAQFNSESYDVSTTVSNFITKGWLAPQYEDIAISYLESYVSYDGGWEKGKADGKGNFFEIDDYFSKYNIQDNYWGGICYPTVTVAEVKKNLTNGDTKYYVYGVLMYDGKTKKGVENGKGISYYPNGQKKYDGKWKNGKYDGKGKLYDESGQLIYNGKWENGDYAS